MSCIINRSPNGVISSVLTNEGNPSELFQKTNSLPFLRNSEEALDIIALSYDKLSKISQENSDKYTSGEPKIFFKTPEGITESYKQALSSSSAQDIEFGFKGKDGNFIPVKKVSSTLDTSIPEGIINAAIVNGTLSEEKVSDKNNPKGFGSLVGEGVSTYEKGISARAVYTQLSSLKENPYTFENSSISLPTAEETLDGTGKATQEFFGTVVGGEDARYKPSKPYEYEGEVSFSDNEKEFIIEYDTRKGNFDEHIATSIPTFRETQIKKGAALLKIVPTLSSNVIYDLGGSEGSWIKTITNQSGNEIKTINLDPSPEMQSSFNKNKPSNSHMAIEAFYQGWDDIKTHVPTEKAGVVHESMMFQFIDNMGERMDYIKEVKNNYLTEDGLFITEEKFKMPTEEEYKRNEALKNPHKDKYYTKEQQSLKSDEVLVGMKENQASYEKYIEELKSEFKFVQPYWVSGNFRGIVASNNEESFKSFLNEVGQTSLPQYTIGGTSILGKENKSEREAKTENKIQFSIQHVEDASANFERWSKGLPIVEGLGIQTLKTGEAAIIKGYHGTTHNFYEFDASKGHIDGHLGRVNYFSSDFRDSDDNYGGIGTDLEGRISELADNIRYDLEEMGKEDVMDIYNLSEEEYEDMIRDETESEVAQMLVEKQLVGETAKVLDLYLRVENPVILGYDPVVVDQYDINEVDSTTLNNVIEEVAEDLEVSVEEVKEKFMSDVMQNLVENGHIENKISNALEFSLSDNGYPMYLAQEILGEYMFDDTIDLNQVEKWIRGSSSLYGNDQGEYAMGEVISDFFKNLGYDAIILTDVYRRFNMGSTNTYTSHIHLFNDNRNSIKLADGSNVTFNDSNDIRYSLITDFKVTTNPSATEIQKSIDVVNKSIAKDPGKYWTVDALPLDAKGKLISVGEEAYAFVAPDSDIKSVVKDVDSSLNSVASQLLKKAVELGGRKLDNFNVDGLSNLYFRNGFKVIGRTKFVEELAPEAWDKVRDGTPDVVAMIYDPYNIVPAYNTRFDSYEEMIEFRDAILAENLDKINESIGNDNRLLNKEEVTELITPLMEKISANFEVVSSEELKKLGGLDPDSNVVPKGAVINDKVYLNSDVITLDTPIHELGHLWLNFAEREAIDHYMKGLDLINSEGEYYKNIVRKTQPNLKEGSTEFLEEALAEAIGDSGRHIINKKKNNSFKQWLDDLFSWIADMVGISGVSPEELHKMSLKDFTDAVAVDILKGGNLNSFLKSNENGVVVGVTPNNLKEFSSIEGMHIKQELYPQEYVKPLPVKNLAEAIKQYEGRVAIITSDATGVHFNERGELMQGGPGYIALSDNILGDIGFASLDEKTAQALGSRVQTIGAGKPVLVLIMVQNLPAILGNKYSGEHFFKELDKLTKKRGFKTFKKSLTNLMKEGYAKYIKTDTFKNSPLTKKEHEKLLFDALDKFGSEGINIDELIDIFSDHTNFNFRRSLLDSIISDRAITKSVEGDKRVVREFLKKHNVDFKNFSDAIIDKSINREQLNKGKKQLDQDLFSAVVAGFGMETFDDPASMRNYITAAQSRGVDHKQFNGKVPAIKGSQFFLDKAYNVHANFGDYSTPTIELSKEGLKLRSKLLEEFNPKYKGVPYKDVNSNDKIRFKEYIVENYPHLLSYKSGNVNADVAQSLGFRQKENAAQRMLEDINGKRTVFSMGSANPIRKSGSSTLDTVSREVAKNLSKEETQKLEMKYGVSSLNSQFLEALSKDILDTMLNGKSGSLLKAATKLFRDHYATLPQSEIQELKGLDRNLYNKATGQSTVYRAYPNTKDNEVAFISGNGVWEVTPREEAISNFKDGTQDVNGVDGAPIFVATEEIYKDESQEIEQGVDYSKIMSENEKTEITKQLFKVLERLGFSTLRLSEYIKSYRQKNGLDISVEAISDITNRIVAIAEGGNIDALLSEEVAHILTETYSNQDEIRELLPEVESTQEWADHSAKYFKLYEGKGLTNEQVVEKVRREILGKLIAEKIAKGNTQTSLLQRANQVVSNFFSRVKSFLRPSIKSKLDAFTSKIADSVYEESKLDTMYNVNNLNDNIFGEFYNATDSTMTIQLNNMIRDSRKLLSKQSSRGSLSSKVDSLSTIASSGIIDSLQTLKAASYYLDISNYVKRNVHTKVKKYDEEVKAGRSPKVFLNSLDNASMSILVTENLPHLQTLLSEISSMETPSGMSTTELKKYEDKKKKIIEQTKTLIQDINVLKGEITSRNTAAGINLLDTLSNEYNISPEAQREIKDYLTNVSKDISTLQGFFGNLQHAPNPVLGLFGRIIGDIYHRTDVSSKHFSRTFINTLSKLGINQEDYQKTFDRLVQRTGENKLTGYLKSVIDWGAFHKAQEANEIEAYNKANAIRIAEKNASMGTSLVQTPITSLDEIGKSPENPRLTEFSGNSLKTYNTTIQEWRDENLEQPYDRSFRTMREDMINDIKTSGITLSDGTVVKNIPDVILEMMGGWASKRRELKAPYIKDGVVDYSKMSSIEREELASIKRERLEAKSTVDSVTGLEKTGDDLDIALALQAIEQYYINNGTGTRKVKTEFLDKLKSFTNPREAYEWFSLNSGFTFNTDFWDAISASSESTVEKYRQIVEDIPNADIDPYDRDELLSKVDQLGETLKRRTQFLKQFKGTTSPSETETSVMSDGAKSIFIDMEQTVEVLFKELGISLEKYTTKPLPTNNLLSESTTNESFERDYAEFKQNNPTSDITDFIKNHATINNLSLVASFKSNLKRFEASGTLTNSSVFKKALEKQLGLPDGSSSSEISNALLKFYTKNGNSYESLLEGYAKTKVAGYYKRFAPKGFTEFIESLKAGSLTDASGKTINLGDLVESIENGNPIQLNNNLSKYLSVNPEAEWMEDESNLTENPNFIKDVEGSSTKYGGYNQPRVDKYMNREFVNKYNIDLDTYFKTGETRSKGTTAEREKELALSEFLVQSRYENFKNQEVDGMANAYSLPGVRKAAVHKAKDFFKDPKNSLREWWKDFIVNSVDKKIYGESSTGELDGDPKDTSRLVVPTLNVRPLENVQDTSTDLLYSYTVHTYNANLFRNRQDAMSKANQLETLLLSKDFKDVSAQNSKTYEMFLDFKRAYLLGVQETKRFHVGIGGKQIDLTNVLRAFDRALGTVNVGMNPAVSITAGTSAVTFSVTEAVAGQYINVDSFKKGVAMFHSKAGSFLNETGAVDKKNEVYVLGERFGIYNVLNGVENSGESRVLREMFKDGVGGMAHFMTDIATKPFSPSLMYGVLDNTRFVSRKDNNGNTVYELMSFEKFKEAAVKTGLTPSEVKSKWKSLESNSLLKNISVKDGMVEYSDFVKGEVFKGLSKEDLDTTLNSIELDVRNVLSTLISKVDAKMPMYDKSAASRNALARFLLRHREWFTILLQNRFKRGHNNLYTGQYEEGSYITVGRFLTDVFKAFNPKNDTKLREVFETLTPTEKLNLRRVLIDTAISAVLVAFGRFVVSPWGDDDENKDNWKVQFFAYMYYRLASEQMSSGITGIPSYKDVLEAPIVAMNSVKEIMKPSNWSGEEVANGAYEGHSKIFRLAAKNTFARHYFDLVKGLNKKSDFYRLNNEWTLWGMQKQSAAEKAEAETQRKEMEESYMRNSEKFMR